MYRTYGLAVDFHRRDAIPTRRLAAASARCEVASGGRSPAVQLYAGQRVQ